MDQATDQGKQSAGFWTPPETIPHCHAGPCACEPALAYVRVSQVGDREILLSPDIQLQKCLEKADKTGRRIVRIFSDINRSGQTFRKRSVDQCIKLIEKKVVRGVIIWKWSRWGRNQVQSAIYLKKTSLAGGWVESATEDFDQKTAIGRFTRDQVMRIDQLVSEQLGESWQNAHAMRRLNGLPHSGRKRFGYDYVRAVAVPGGQTIPARFVKNETEAPILEQLYSDFLKNTSPAALAERLNQLGIRTAMNGPWTREALLALLDTGFAAGLIRERSPEVLATIKAQEKALRNSLRTFDIWRTGSHEPIIEMPLWEKYKARRMSQMELPPRSRTGVHALSTFLLCELCANRLRTKYSGSYRQHQWVCPRNRSHHPGVSVSVSDRAAQNVVLRWFESQALAPDTDDLVDEKAQMYAISGEPPKRSRTQINAEIKRWMKKLDNLVDMRTDDLIDRDTFLTNKNTYEDKVRELQSELASLTELAGNDGKPPYEVFESIAATWTEAPAAERHALVGKTVKFVVVSPAGGRMGHGHDAADRLEVVGVWQASSWDRWLSARRRRLLA